MMIHSVQQFANKLFTQLIARLVSVILNKSLVRNRVRPMKNALSAVILRWSILLKESSLETAEILYRGIPTYDSETPKERSS